MQGPADGSRLLWKIGRGSLASSHAGTRLPIAVFPARTQGAPPRPAPGGPGAPVFVSSDAHPFRLKVKTAGTHGCPPYGMSGHHFLRWHYPHQVKGRSARFLSAGIGSPVLSALLWHRLREFVKRHIERRRPVSEKSRRRPSGAARQALRLLKKRMQRTADLTHQMTVVTTKSPSTI